MEKIIKKILIVHEKEIKDSLKKNILNNVNNASIDTSSENYTQKDIPLGYDLHIIHPSQTNEESLKEIKMKQPESKIIAISGALIILKDIERMVDKYLEAKGLPEQLIQALKDLENN